MRGLATGKLSVKRRSRIIVDLLSSKRHWNGREIYSRPFLLNPEFAAQCDSQKSGRVAQKGWEKMLIKRRWGTSRDQRIGERGCQKETGLRLEDRVVGTAQPRSHYGQCGCPVMSNQFHDSFALQRRLGTLESLTLVLSDQVVSWKRLTFIEIGLPLSEKF